MTINNLSHTIRKFNRFELKYLISLRQADKFKSALQAYLTPDEYGGKNGRYALTSLYYDSPNLRCYCEQENGIRVRRKLRLRYYGAGSVVTEETPVFLEIRALAQELADTDGARFVNLEKEFGIVGRISVAGYLKPLIMLNKI